MIASTQTKGPQQILKKMRPQWIDISVAMALGVCVGYIVFISFPTHEDW